MDRTHDILLVDDDATVIAALRRQLQGLGRLHLASHGAGALRRARAQRPDPVPDLRRTERGAAFELGALAPATC